ncbi:hypothetical protein LZD49_28640 [Dyadobacter sp. CY261]|uniref:hypothetical protein n=1 Tax=Dyadobacter sp. CY261 TaxID=2907203 RepID=UPI001F45A581|nr:hypothetical protein [Dyadobacter sp. CY261]MCF0074487.1 hypothetical protein [Dyadobacter sp. CY261]
MAGLLQRLQETVTAPLDKFFPADPTINDGTIWLTDLGNSLQGISGVPANGAVVNNIAWDIAKRMIPSGTQSTLSGNVAQSLDIVGSKAFAERTPKGGLHVIISQAVDVDSGNDFAITLPSLIKDYLLDNPTHEFFTSVWGHTTRVATVNPSGVFYCYQNSTNFKFAILQQGMVPNSLYPSNTIGTSASANTVGGFRKSIGFKGYIASGVAGSPPAAGSRSNIYFQFKIGSKFPWATTETNKAASLILYRLYIEDLTVSGRTYAQADLADTNFYNEAFGSGGRFNGDSFTSPSTLP